MCRQSMATCRQTGWQFSQVYGSLLSEPAGGAALCSTKEVRQQPAKDGLRIPKLLCARLHGLAGSTLHVAAGHLIIYSPVISIADRLIGADLLVTFQLTASLASRFHSVNHCLAKLAIEASDLTSRGHHAQSQRCTACNRQDPTGPGYLPTRCRCTCSWSAEDAVETHRS